MEDYVWDSGISLCVKEQWPSWQITWNQIMKMRHAFCLNFFLINKSHLEIFLQLNKYTIIFFRIVFGLLFNIRHIHLEVFEFCIYKYSIRCILHLKILQMIFHAFFSSNSNPASNNFR